MSQSRTAIDVEKSATRPTQPEPDGSTVNLQRLAADITDSPHNVQHWNTTPDQLDDLLDELRAKPGTHAVHVKGGLKKQSRRKNR